MQKSKKKHLYNVMAAGEDILEFGISEEEKRE